MSDYKVALSAAGVQAILAELNAIAARRGSLPEFRKRLLKIVEALPRAFETRWVDVEDLSAATAELVLALEFRKPFLRRVTAFRAFDRDFDAVGKTHGASV